VNFSLVNCDPWSLLKMSGRPRRSARFSASTQNSTSMVSDSDQLSTNRLNQSITAGERGQQGSPQVSNPPAARAGLTSIKEQDITLVVRYGIDKITAPAGVAAFTDMMFTDLIPMVERTDRVLPGRENRAMAGLSM
jgi:hypothetical protein